MFIITVTYEHTYVNICRSSTVFIFCIKLRKNTFIVENKVLPYLQQYCTVVLHRNLAVFKLFNLDI